MGGGEVRGYQPQRRTVHSMLRATRGKEVGESPGYLRAAVLRGETGDTSRMRETRVGGMGGSGADVLRSLRGPGPPQKRRMARVVGQSTVLDDRNREGRRSVFLAWAEEDLEDLGTRVAGSEKKAGEYRGDSQNTWSVRS